MSEHRHDPAGTRNDETDHLTNRATLPGESDPGPTAVPGAYAADDADQERGTAVSPGD